MDGYLNLLNYDFRASGTNSSARVTGTLTTVSPRCRRGRGYAVEPHMPDTGLSAVRGRSRFASGTRLLIRRACVSKPGTAYLRKRTPPL